MKLLETREVASIVLLSVEVSEDELDVYESCLKYIYENLSEQDIERVCGATRDEVLAIRDDILDLLKAFTNLRAEAAGTGSN